MADKRWSLLLWAGCAWIAAAVLSVAVGAVDLTLPELWQAVTAGPSDTAGYILWYVRLPRTAACLLAGGALAVSGAVVQNVLNNKLASPGIIGINAGAGLGVTVCCAAGVLSGWAISGAAFAGALLCAALVVGLARRISASRSTVILSGVAVNAFVNALSESVVKLVPEISMVSADFRVGGFGSVSYPRLVVPGVLIVVSVGAVLTLRNELDVLALGEETARSVGLSVKNMQTVFLILAALLAGSAVSFAGLLGFVGLLVPHGVRRIAGSESRMVIPLCALGGGAFVTGCDLLCRVLFAPFELPVGIGMAVLGGPCFLFMVLGEKGGRRFA